MNLARLCEKPCCLAPISYGYSTRWTSGIVVDSLRRFLSGKKVNIRLFLRIKTCAIWNLPSFFSGDFLPPEVPSGQKYSERIFPIQRTMYKVEGRCPERRSHLALEHYRTVRNADRFDSGGLLPTNGPAWEKMRKQFQVRAPLL